MLPLCHKTTNTVAAALCDDVITRVSIPSVTVSDLGGEFVGEAMKRLCDCLGITHLRTTAYHLQTRSVREYILTIFNSPRMVAKTYTTEIN